MTTMTVSYTDERLPFSTTDIFSQVVEGTLSDEHPMSGYGLPVLIAEHGTVYGPGEVSTISALLDDDEEIPAILHRAKTAGFDVRIRRRGEPISAPSHRL
jgi:hypothetical protein